MLALADPKDHWSPELEHALTAGVLIDLASQSRIDLDEGGALRVLDSTPTDRSVQHRVPCARRPLVSSGRCDGAV
jgi:hypothetical protein